MTILFKPKKIAILLSMSVICLTAAHIAGQLLIQSLGPQRLLGLGELFDLNGEGNVPALFSTLTLFLCFVLFATVAFVKRARGGGSHFLYWGGMAVVFFYLAVDESVGLHERLIFPVRSALGTSGLLYFAWVVPYGILLVALALAYVKFLLRLPRKTQLLLIAAAVIYISGAIGFELLGGRYDELYGRDNLAFVALSTFEEICEMAGIVVLIYALTSYLGAEAAVLRIKVMPSWGERNSA